MGKNPTIVTGLWDINRGELKEGWARSFQHYLNKFDELLKIENNLIIFGEEDIQDFVWERRKPENTQLIIRNKEWFKHTIPFDKIQEIRNSDTWKNQAGWLSESTQGRLEWYNPLVMSKVFLLNDARILDKFDSDDLYWLDAGITNTIHQGYFTHDKIQNKLSTTFNKFSFIAFPYEADREIHGFSYPKINEYAGGVVKLVGRGGLFGGPKHTIADINGIYHDLLTSTLSDGYMGTEESIFSIMMYKYPELVDYAEIKSDGLISTFCEDLKNNRVKVKKTKVINNVENNLNPNNTGLYVITFNSPKQFETLIKSMLLYDDEYITKRKKFLLDNSSDLSTTEKYSELCKEYGFEHIKKDNLGICGGRQFIAEHAEEQNLDFYLFFEDDMFFFNGEKQTCKNGFNRHVKNLYRKSLEIVKKENFDFLKLNYTEFYGDNGTQWSWYNVPQDVREKLFPTYTKLPIRGLDPNAPKTKFTKVVSHSGVPYAAGEVYYCNWPQIVSKYGNKKMFLETKWSRPFEQTWMSFIYQETVKGNINPGILLITPTEHDRFEHYDGKLRKES